MAADCKDGDVWKKELNLTLVAEQSTLPMRVFECLFTFSFLMWMGYCLVSWEEWLTKTGFHLSANELRLAGYPDPWPLLEPWQVPVFAGLVLSGAALVFWPLAPCGKVVRIMGSGWARRLGLITLFLCALYAQRVDYMMTFSGNKIFIGVFGIIALAPAMTRCTVTGRLMQSVAPLRVLQAFLILHYFASGLAKMNGDWLHSPDVLWAQLQGIHRTEFAAWALRTLPRWTWTVQQHMALIFEVAAPLLFTLRFLRPAAIVIGITFHLMIALTMWDLIYFSALMWPFYALFITAEEWRAIGARVRRLCCH